MNSNRIGSGDSVPRPRISIVMAARNEEHRIALAIESILEQTFEAWELVVVDDGSQDETAAVAASFDDRRIQVVQTGPHGLSAALNRGLATARAPLIARQDADDRSLPERLARQVEFLDTRPDVAVVGSAWVELGPDGVPVKPRTAVATGLLNDVLARFNPLIHSAATFRKTAILRSGGYNVDVRFAQDYELWLRLARAGEKLWNLDEKLVVRVMTGENIAARYEWRLRMEELRVRWRDLAERRRQGLPYRTQAAHLARRAATFPTPRPVRRVARRLRGQAV